MAAPAKHIRHGFGAVRPYLYGRLDAADFVQQVFDAEILEKLPGKGYHLEARIGDSAIVIEACEPSHPTAKPASIYVYVDDVDATYARAIKFGAVSVSPPEDKPYQERACGVKDSYGNTWYIATYTG